MDSSDRSLQKINALLNSDASATATSNQFLQSLNTAVAAAAASSDTGFNICNFRTKIIRFTPTVDTSAYAAGDVLFNTTAVTISNNATQAARGTILTASIVDRDDQASQTITLYFFNSNVALGTINLPPSITDDNASNSIIGSCTVTTGTDLGGCKFGETQGLVIPFELTGSTIWVAAVTGGTPTHTASGIRVRLSIQLETAA